MGPHYIAGRTKSGDSFTRKQILCHAGRSLRETHFESINVPQIVLSFVACPASNVMSAQMKHTLYILCTEFVVKLVVAG